MIQIREVFWTGGWDSTFRIVQLSREDVTVQPVYISGDGRKSEPIEIERIRHITELLLKKTETRANILPLKIVDKKDIPENQAITDAYYEIRKNIPIGTQYEFLARYAICHPYVEIGPECPDGEFSGIVEAINTYGKLCPYGDSWILDSDNSTEQCKLLFGNFSYPIIKITERQMLAMIREWKYEDIMAHIWFCHRPIKNKPCGLCRPCEQKMDEHMEFLLDKRAQKRYKNARMAEKIAKRTGRRIISYIYRIFNF